MIHATFSPWCVFCPILSDHRQICTHYNHPSRTELMVEYRYRHRLGEIITMQKAKIRLIHKYEKQTRERNSMITEERLEVLCEDVGPKTLLNLKIFLPSLWGFEGSDITSEPSCPIKSAMLPAPSWKIGLILQYTRIFPTESFGRTYQDFIWMSNWGKNQVNCTTQLESKPFRSWTMLYKTRFSFTTWW